MSEKNIDVSYVPSSEAITLKELAKLVGRSYASVYTDVQNGYVPGHMFIGRIFIEPGDVPGYIRRCEVADRIRKGEK